MGDEKTLTFYLEEPMRSQAEVRRVNIVNRIAKAFESCGYQTLFRDNSDQEILASANRPGYAMFHMEEPFHSRALTLRKAYYYPFWRIGASAKRWKSPVAAKTFDPTTVTAKAAQQFARYWRRRLFGDMGPPGQDQGFVLVALQGRLLEHRSFQSASPIDMLQATARANPDRPVVAALHPRESYSEQEMRAMSRLCAATANLEIATQTGDALLVGCTCVVTQNSSVALAGYFHAKPAVLFGRIDFHHIAANVHDLGVDAAFAQAHQLHPDYDKYLYWFLQLNSINAGREDAEEKILAAVRNCGWDV
jgi:hypothetical protein